jgi:hypothetical protein
MAVDLTDVPVLAEPVAAPPVRQAPRHRRRLDLPALAERLWRPPLALAVAVFAACGPAHALGHTDLVFAAVLVALVLAGAAVPLGLVALRHRPAGTDTDG